jgi:flagellar biosynthesis/type III secretory pathway chaperone
MKSEPVKINCLGEKLHDSLKELIQFHRQLHDIVKNENEAISTADTKGTYDASAAKEALVHLIYQTELSRQSIVQAIIHDENIESKNPSLRDLIIHFQSKNPELSNRLQSDFNMLMVLVDRIKKLNELNGKLVAESLRHISNMKKNIFGETTHQARTYNQQGQKNEGSAKDHGPRLISREA